MHFNTVVYFLNFETGIVLNNIFAPECSSLSRKKGPGNNLQVKNSSVHKKHTQKVIQFFEFNSY